MFMFANVYMQLCKYVGMLVWLYVNRLMYGFIWSYRHM